MKILYTIFLNLVVYSYGIADITNFSSYSAKYEVYYRGIEAGEMIFNYQKKGNEIEITVETIGNYLAKLIGRDKEIQKLKIKYKNSKPYPIYYEYKKIGRKNKEYRYIYSYLKNKYELEISEISDISENKKEFKSDEMFIDGLFFKFLSMTNLGNIKNEYNLVSKDNVKKIYPIIKKNQTIRIENKSYTGFSVTYINKNKNNITFYAEDDLNKMVYKEIRKNDKSIVKIYFKEELIKIKWFFYDLNTETGPLIF